MLRDGAVSGRVFSHSLYKGLDASVGIIPHALSPYSLQPVEHAPLLLLLLLL